jgi:peptidoglycan/xylan/chitin deacetylase (PgdA/CDA1 family)
MPNKTTVPVLMGVSMALLALPVVGSFRAIAREGTPAAAEAEVEEVSCEGYVALTFDDGPTPLTPAILEILEEHGARATMFNLGSAAEADPDQVEAQLAAGHAVENHSQTHPDLTQLDPEEVASEIVQANETLRAAGADPQWFRPPFGYTDDRVKAAVAAAGLREVIWTTDTFDWQEGPVSTVVERALDVEPGGIILMHDGKQRTVDALPAILDGLAESGLCAGQIVPSDTTHSPSGWHENTYQAEAGPWSVPAGDAS